MIFQWMLNLVLLFTVVWMFLKFILPMFYSDSTKEKIAEEDAVKVAAKKEALKRKSAKLSSLEEELIVTKELKNVSAQSKNIVDELENVETELADIDKAKGKEL